jgi:hypothetical protein
LPDLEGALRPVATLLDDALRLASRYSDELGCAEELARLPALVADGGGAGRQRRAYGIAGMDALLRELTAISSPPEPQRARSREQQPPPVHSEVGS